MTDERTLRRLALGGVVLAVVISVPASVVFLVPYGMDMDRLLSEPGSIVASGPQSATLFRLGAVGDLLYSYVLLAPLALYLHRLLRPRGAALADLGLLAAVAYIAIGATGAAILAAAGAPLIEAHAAAAASERVVIATAFDTLARAVFHGMWQTTHPFTLGTWILTTGWLIRDKRRKLGRLVIVVGVGLFLTSLRTVFGKYGVDLILAGGAALLLVWLAWVAFDRGNRRTTAGVSGV